MAVKSNGDVYAWGHNTRGRFGMTEGEKDELPTPEKITNLK